MPITQCPTSHMGLMHCTDSLGLVGQHWNTNQERLSHLFVQCVQANKAIRSYSRNCYSLMHKQSRALGDEKCCDSTSSDFENTPLSHSKPTKRLIIPIGPYSCQSPLEKVLRGALQSWVNSGPGWEPWKMQCFVMHRTGALQAFHILHSPLLSMHQWNLDLCLWK